MASAATLSLPRRRLILAALGPGLLVMLADTDAGSIITAAQSGAQWGYKLLALQILLIPILYMVQELTVRLGLVTGRGHGELIRDTFGRGWAWFSVGTLMLACVGAIVTQLAQADAGRGDPILLGHAARLSNVAAASRAWPISSRSDASFLSVAGFSPPNFW